MYFIYTHTHSLVGSDKCNPKLNEMCKWNRSEDWSKMSREALMFNAIHLTCLLGIQVHLSSRQRMHGRRPRLSHCLEVVRELDKQMSKGMHLKENQWWVSRSWDGADVPEAEWEKGRATEDEIWMFCWRGQIIQDPVVPSQAFRIWSR